VDHKGDPDRRVRRDRRVILAEQAIRVKLEHQVLRDSKVLRAQQGLQDLKDQLVSLGLKDQQVVSGPLVP